MEWVSVKTEKPKVGINLFFFNGKKEVTYGYAYDWQVKSNNYVWIYDKERETNEIATHWMPLPKPPKE